MLKVWTYFRTCSNVSIVNYEKVNVGCEKVNVDCDGIKSWLFDTIEIDYEQTAR